LNEIDRATLAKNLRLVSELGGELVSTVDTNIAEALERIAHQRRVTQLVVGKPTRRWRDFFVGTILDRLARRSSTYDILMLRPDKSAKSTTSEKSEKISLRPLLKDCGVVLAIMFVVTLFNYSITPIIGYKAVGFLFLLAVLLLSLWYSLGAVFLSAVLGALTWNYFFIPPVGTFIITDTADVLMVLSYLAVALVSGTLAHRIRTRQKLIRRREERTELLYDLTKTLAAHTNISDIMKSLSKQVESLLKGEVDLILASTGGRLESTSVLGYAWVMNEKERAVAFWAFEHDKRAGWSTDTLPLSDALYAPLKGTSGKLLGILAFRPYARAGLTQDESNLLAAISHQLALSLERELFRREAQETERFQESERLMQTVIDSVSHELRTPLTALAGTSSALASNEIIADPKRRSELIDEIQKMTSRLNRIVGNLLDMSRLSSGGMKLQKDWHELSDVVGTALNSAKSELQGRRVEVRLGDNLPLIRIDLRLFSQVLENILSNAAMYSPPDAIVEIECRVRGSKLELLVLDNGPGIPESSLEHVFTKFYRVPGTRPGGVGLGLSIAKAIVEAHGGSITARNRSTGGASIEISLPIESQPSLPPEEN
jgi:two-component system sensor histidine kinase KdpD